LRERYEPLQPTTETLNYKIYKIYSNIVFHMLTVTRRLPNDYPTVMNQHAKRRLGRWQAAGNLFTPDIYDLRNILDLPFKKMVQTRNLRWKIVVNDSAGVQGG
jgi:hypothetical protein